MARPVLCQQEKAFESISVAEGLSQGMVFDMLQDEEGFIWVATKSGLNRYDGYGFKIFMNDPYNEYTLSSNTLNELFEDSKGRIWAGTENAGVNVYDKKTGLFYRIAHDPSNPSSLSGNGIRIIEEMADGRMLIATDQAGLNILNLPSDWKNSHANPKVTRLSLPGNRKVWGMGKDPDGNMWVCSLDGVVYRFDPEANSFVSIPGFRMYNSGYLNQDGSVLINNNLYLDKRNEIVPLFDTDKIPEGNILIATKSDLWEYHHRELYFYEISRWEKNRPVNWMEELPLATSTRICYPFLIDRSGILWSGAVGYGLRKYKNIHPLFVTKAPGNSLRMIVPAGNQDLYMVDYGYNWMNLKKDILQKDVFALTPGVKEVDNFIISSKNEYWIKSDKAGYFSFDPESNRLTAYPQINTDQAFGRKQPFLEDSRKRIWLPGQDGKISIWDPLNQKLDSIQINPGQEKIICTAILEDRNGTFWIGTENGYLKINIIGGDLSTAQIQWFYNDVQNRNSLNYNLVSCFLEDPFLPDQYLWIATKGGGLNRLDKRTGDYDHLTQKEGLPDNVVYGILADGQGNIWGSTNKGLFCMSKSDENQKRSFQFRNFTKTAGLQDDEFNSGAFAKLPDGMLAFGGVNGLNIFDPKEILEKSFTPPIYLTQILVGNVAIWPNDKTGILKNTIENTQSITLNHLQDILTLEFSSLDFTAPEQNKYRYRLAGIDPDWVESGNRRTATYLHLPSGRYVFKVQGSNNQGIWSNQTAEIEILVKPPWWLSWWAYALYGLCAAVGVRSYFRFKVNKARLQSQLHFEKNEAKRVKELDAIKTQLYANITHEFRTPLTVILGMANQIKNDPQKYLQSGVDMIVRNGENLLKLVNEMLDLSKLEDGKMTLRQVKGDIIAFLRYIVESFQSLAASEQKQFHFFSDTDELLVAFDPEKFRQIITNLFSNALKFTPAHGNIYVNISREAGAPGHETVNVVLRVKDTGTGIPESELHQIFERFYQLDNSSTRRNEGTGIGLALTRELVRLMDGSIQVKSPPVGATRGSEFIIRIPLKVASQSDVESIQVSEIHESEFHSETLDKPISHFIPETAAPSGSPVVLLVEDNTDVVAYTASCLSDYKLLVGKDGREGFEIATGSVPDLIITDVMMPHIDGFEMCRMLRQDERTSHIPVIMLTAKADMQSKLEGIAHGADVYLEKPFHKEELLLRIKKLLEQRKILQAYYIRQIGMTAIAESVQDHVSQVDFIKSSEHEFVKKVKDLVEGNFTNYDFSVEQLSKSLFMSHSQLHRKLEALTGCSPNKFIRSVRLNKAKELLSDPSLNIAMISLDCGYNDPAYFARVFKQETGLSPQEWRSRDLSK